MFTDILHLSPNVSETIVLDINIGNFIIFVFSDGAGNFFTKISMTCTNESMVVNNIMINYIYDKEYTLIITALNSINIIRIWTLF